MFAAIGLIGSYKRVCSKGCKSRIQLFRCLRNLGQTKGNLDINTLPVVTVLGIFVLTFGRMVAMIRRLRMNVIRALRMESRFELNMTIGAKTQHGPVRTIANQREANEHSNKLFSYMFPRYVHKHSPNYTTSSYKMQALWGGLRRKIPDVRTLFFTSLTVLGDFPIYIALRGHLHFPGKSAILN